MGTRVEAIKTTATPAEMYGALRLAWVARFRTEPRRESLLVLLAQTAFETGRWRTGFWCWNLGNIKHLGSADAHDFCFFRCSEVIKGKIEWLEEPDPGACFRAYLDLGQGVADFLGFLHDKYSPAWAAVESGSPALFVEAIKRLRYFTGDLRTYEDSVVSIFHEYSATIVVPALDLHTVKGQQHALNLLGANPQLVEDGAMGEHTREAIAAYQHTHGLVPDGVAGPLTLRALGRSLVVQAPAPVDATA